MSKNTQRGEVIALAQDVIAGTNNLTIQVLRAGEFVDMHGKEFALTGKDLDAYIANSNAYLATTEVPIETGHPDDAGAPAAAWYRKFLKKVVDGVEWVCAEIELTALGADALAQKLYKYFSANIWIDDQVIFGGGFVNRPAVEGQQPLGSLAAAIRFVAPIAREQIMSVALPVQLGRNIAKLEMSQEEAARKLWDALRAKYGDPLDEYSWSLPWIEATYSDYIIVKKDGDFYKIQYAFDGDNVNLGDPVKVEIVWTPKETSASLSAGTATTVPAPIQSAIQTAMAVPAAGPQGGTMSLSAPSSGAPAPAPAPTPAPAATVPTIAPVASPPANVTAASNPAEVEQLVQQAREDERRAAQAQATEIEAQLAKARGEERQRVMAELQRKEKVNSLVIKLTSGPRQFPYRPNDLGEALLKLSDADYDIVAPILEKVQASGLVDLGERGGVGHGMTAVKHLNDEQKESLRKFVRGGGKVETFLTANGLGEAKEYDLSEFGVPAN